MSEIATVQNPFGTLLQHWRRARRMSQLALSLEADVSQRHISFVESGRAHPSRDLVLTLAAVLDIPLRERNALLSAAGYAGCFRESALDDPDMGTVRRALDLILAKHEPYPAVVLDRHWNLVDSNRAAPRFFARFIDLRVQPQPLNILRLMFHPNGMRPYVANWEEVIEALLQRAYREVLGGMPDDTTAALIQEVLRYPDVPPRLRMRTLGPMPTPIVPIRFRKGDFAMSYFSAVTTLGTPQDVTSQEIRLEAFFPVDAATEAGALKMAAEG